MELHFRISDPDLCEELKKHEQGEERDAFAIRAMWIGIIAIRHAQGRIDADEIRQEGKRIIEKTESTLTNYLDPKKGKFHQRIQQLIEESGELEKIIRKQIEGNDSPLNQTLAEWIGKILDEFTLDNNKDSALKRMLKLLEEKYDKILEKIGEEKGREEELGRSTRHGVKFENVTVSNFIQEWNERKCDANHIVEHTGGKSGVLRTEKRFRNIGDFVIELGPDHADAGCKIVVEAKANKDYTLARAFKELEEARKNRGAEVGLFVFDKNHSPRGLDCFTRRGNDIVIVWDAEDENSGVNFEAGLSLAVALCVKAKIPSKEGVDLVAMDKAILEIESGVKDLEEIRTWTRTIKNTWTRTIKNNSEHILKNAEKMQSSLNEQIRILKENIDVLR